MLQIPGDGIRVSQDEQITRPTFRQHGFVLVDTLSPPHGLDRPEVRRRAIDPDVRPLRLAACPRERIDRAEEPIPLRALGRDDPPTLLTQRMSIAGIVAEIPRRRLGERAGARTRDSRGRLSTRTGR
ncbi:Hypothetical protein A7982_00640 [Minicystis rosea]|nr:Hypothetical protein A7982_00640 [Minicystis rosea]